MSVYEKTQARHVGVADGESGGGVLRLQLNRDDFTEEHLVSIVLAQAANVAPTAVSNALALVEKIEIETERGVEFSTTGLDIQHLNQITENVSSQRETLGLANVIEFGFDLHAALDGADYDLLTGMESGQRNKYTLVLTFNKSAASIFTGGTLSGLPTYTVNVEAEVYPALNGLGDLQGSGFEGAGSFVHRINTNVKDGTTKGRQQPISLVSAGSLLRFLQLACFDTSGATPVASDDVLDGVIIMAGTNQEYASTFKRMQRKNEAARYIARLGSGVAFADFGDQVSGFMDFGDISEATVILVVSATAPASYSINITEDFVTQQSV